ncbi:glutathione-disulfide reductase [Lysobacter xanthus]
MPDARSDFDLIVIGGGSGGLAGAFRAAGYGARVALLEPAALGGTCVNVGCVPKKAMWLAAEVAGKLRQAAALGFAASECAFDWPTFIAHRERYIEGIHAGYRRRLEAAGIALLPSRGTLVGPRRVRMDDGVVLAADHVLLATGGHPVRPDIPGAELGGVSDDFFAWRAAPPSVAIVGGGYIAVELAGVLQMLGSRVTLRARGPRLLDSFDEEIVAQLQEDYRHLGVDIRTGTATTAVERIEGGLRLQDSTGAWSDPVDEVLFATGRRPNTAGLGLDTAGVAVDARGYVPVDPVGRTTVDGLYAVGDLTPMPALTPVAIAVARRLMDRVFGGRERNVLALDHVPTVVFTHPPIGRIGPTEAEARAVHGDDVHVLRAGFRPMLHALSGSPHRSLFKIVCVGDDSRVVGLHLLGDAADEMLQGFAVAMHRGLTLDDLHDTIAIHPTSAEEVVLMR